MAAYTLKLSLRVWAPTASVAAIYPYAFPDSSPGSTCGPKHNVEAAFVSSTPG